MRKEQLYIISQTYHYLCCVFLGAFVGGLSSCISQYGYNFTINNLTNEEMTVISKTIIPDYRVQVHDYYENGAFNRYYDNMYDTVFIVPPRSSLSILRYWESRSFKEMISPQGLSDTPESDGVIPAWKFIKHIKFKDFMLSPSIWNTEKKWRAKETGNYEKEYILELTEDMLMSPFIEGTSHIEATVL